MKYKVGDRVWCQGYKGVITDYFSFELIEVNWGRFTTLVGGSDIKPLVRA